MKEIYTKDEFWLAVGVIAICMMITVIFVSDDYYDYHTELSKLTTQNTHHEEIIERLKRIEAVTKTYPATDIEEALNGKGNGNPDVKKN